MKNQRFPFLDLQNKKHKDSENTKQIMSSSKHQLSPIGNYNMNISHQDNNIPAQSQQKLTNIQIVKEPSQRIDQEAIMSMTEEEMGEKEYKLCLKKALKESIEENDALRDRIKEISKENQDLKQDLEEKEEALLELAKFYEYCQLNHLNNKSELFQNERISSDNSQIEKRKKSF